MTFPKIIDATEAVEAAEAVETFFKKMGGVTIVTDNAFCIWEV